MSKNPNEKPSAAERGLMIAHLVKLGLPQASMQQIIRESRTRAENRDALAEWIKDRASG